MADLARPKRRRERQPVIAVAYDGESTEDEYFKGWKRHLGPAGLVVTPFYVKSGGNPAEAVKAAAKWAKQDRDFDRLWCVCDRDDSTPAEVAKARDIAKRAGIDLALSVRSFEVWLAGHWARVSTAPVTCEAEAVALVAAHHAYSARAKAMPFSVLRPLTAQACANAAWLEAQGQDNPTTAVHHLVATLAWRTIFHICRRDEWQAARAAGTYPGSSQDAADGFIHFSGPDQVVGSCAKHRAGQDGLVLLVVDAFALGPALKWEASRGGVLFPHLYGVLPVAAVRKVLDLPLDAATGLHLFPPLEGL